MKPLLSTIVFVLLFAVAAVAADKPPAAQQPVGPYLQTISVNITCPSGYGSGGVQGSGAIVLSQIRDGDKQLPSAWIITAHHVIDGQRKVKDVIGKDGSEKKQVTYQDVQIVQEQTEGGRGVGEVKYDARVISVDPRRDIGLLRVRKGDFATSTAKFYLGDAIPVPGTRLYHTGAPGGKELGGTCSLTEGIVSRLGVRIPQFGGSEHGVYDQITCPALGGSSGGLVAIQETGEWCGMITLGIQGGDSFHWMVPVRSVREWAKEVGVEWLLDPKLTRPTEEEISKIPLELNQPGLIAAGKKEPTPAPATAEGDAQRPALEIVPLLIR